MKLASSGLFVLLFLSGCGGADFLPSAGTTPLGTEGGAGTLTGEESVQTDGSPETSTLAEGSSAAETGKGTETTPESGETTLSPFADRVVDYEIGPKGGFNEASLPGIVLGPPQGAGDLQGSTDVFSLGEGGTITLTFSGRRIVDGPGPDFVIFENPFNAGGDPENRFVEAGIVSVSADGETFIPFPYRIDEGLPLGDPDRYENVAGVAPVWPGSDPATIGGDPFDLADIGLPSIRFIRITDAGATIDDPGNHLATAPTAGFDLDAVAALHLEPDA
ncbi:MAG: cell surface protein [Deltaproteobacteria bacterium]|nr:MAG: cell surface protein [Deltaproteobacteria bacterium]